jgi:Fanconi anemia group J protein
VCRGKISEGLDFSDDAARAVCLIGVPYPMFYDPKTILKRYYLDHKQHLFEKLSGHGWYT